MTNILLAGFNGSMGKQVINLIDDHDELNLVAVYNPHIQENQKFDFLPENTRAFNNINEIDVNEIDLWIDFSSPDAVYENTKFALENGINPIIGTSGLSDDDYKKLNELSKGSQIGGIIAPNFSISANLILNFAKEAAKYYSDAEVIEMHHADKKDAPSATALNTAKVISAERQNKSENNDMEDSRGADVNGVKVHAVRLPGYVAHEQVLFGGKGEALTLRQDSFDRSSFMDGVLLAINKVAELKELIFGLNNLI
ncbi:4-hydroxy-tetrahydrodipicolinate reductase [Lactobacillus sp. S2-2]|uniref:4-hydroxy-tetrahydrodipicolinate reductase n=1 Tax=Lactobacillus sp. S2-2 TaxID=2692917 RepID=UPI001F01FACD|nr:4-hydroxy-tetrahydrodipicolinate reductase [Lactobacillus sp. S2-2]MCF6514926.1 4-hydroxy-tetrahydrodipicolinate reductase [Lactobacillus sp. S2-2]